MESQRGLHCVSKREESHNEMSSTYCGKARYRNVLAVLQTWVRTRYSWLWVLTKYVFVQ